MGTRPRRWLIIMVVGLVAAVAGLSLLGAVADDSRSAGGDSSSESALPAPAPDYGSRDSDGSASGESTGSDGVSGSSDSGGAGSPGVSGPTTSHPDADRSGVVAPDAPSTVPSPQPGSSGEPARPAGAQPRVVRDGSVSLWVAPGGVGTALRELSAAAESLKGYTESSESSGTPSTSDDDDQYASVTLRVPSASFDELRSRLDRIGTVWSATTSSRDVTGEYVDLEARKRALEASRSAYITLLAKATTVGETLSVQQAIDGVQIQIEQIEGQRMVLADASDLATLAVRVTEEGADTRTADDDDPSGLAAAVRTSWDRFVGGVEEIVALLGPLALIGLLAALGYLVVRAVAWRMARRARTRVDRTLPVGTDVP